MRNSKTQRHLRGTRSAYWQRVALLFASSAWNGSPFCCSFLFSSPPRPAQRLSIGVTCTAPSLRLIRWKRRGSGTASRLRARVRRFEHREQQERSHRRRTFVTRDQAEDSHYGSGRAGITYARDSHAWKHARRIRQACLSYVLAERKICLYSRHICFVDARRFAQPALALCTFTRQQMASRGTRSQDFSTGSDLEAFCHCFSRFATCNWLRHTAWKLIRSGTMTNALLRGVHVRRRSRVAGASASNTVQFAGWNLPHENRPRW